MRFCSECKKLSKDDDFCSHCGSALFGTEDFTARGSECTDTRGHSHDKITYDSRLGSRVDHHGSEIPVRLKTQDGQNGLKKGQKVFAVIAVIFFLAPIVFFFVFGIMIDIISSLFS
ncbi:MAG: hypothetical protein J6N70_10010 [Oribacterium sp.]|nr:hypothetical protein [Oribacterium sp.]MBQ5330552.1 hypothetical protein [Oscillospiraceae bacterium]